MAAGICGRSRSPPSWQRPQRLNPGLRTHRRGFIETVVYHDDTKATKTRTELMLAPGQFTDRGQRRLRAAEWQVADIEVPGARIEEGADRSCAHLFGRGAGVELAREAFEG